MLIIIFNVNLVDHMGEMMGFLKNFVSHYFVIKLISDLK